MSGFLVSNKHRAKSFLSMLDIDTDECVVWDYASGSHGYGQLWFDGKDQTVHRLALTLKIGDPPNSKSQALHRPNICHNRKCFNYQHLYWGTAKDNHRDSVIDKTHSSPPLHKGVKHPRAKLSEKQVLDIRADKDSHREIAKKYGIVKATVGFIKSKRIWKDLS